MPKSKLQKIKRIIKISLAGFVLIVLIVLGFFVKPTYTFENSSLAKWTSLSESQQVATVKRIISKSTDQDLLLECVTKIAELPDSAKMNIRDAIVLCYNGIKLNTTEDNEK